MNVLDEYVKLNEFDQANWKKFDAEKWTEYKNNYKQHIWNCWGKFAQKDELDSILIEEEQKMGYRIEKYEVMVSSSGEPLWDFIPLWILVPEQLRSTPCPAVIVHHQHAGQFQLGKKEPAGIEGDPQQALGIELVKQGYIVAVFDALSFEERQETGGEIFTFTRLLLYGITLNGKYCYDVSRVVDFLRDRKDVAKDRIGIIGHSLGGQMAIWSALYDERIKLVISSCGFGRISGSNSILAYHRNHNLALYLPNILDPKYGLDMHEVIGLLHPRPIFLSNGCMDLHFPIDGVAEIHKWLESLYQTSNDGFKIVTLRHAGGHFIPELTKHKMWEFLEKHI
jgi:dienelactone hydrolase